MKIINSILLYILTLFSSLFFSKYYFISGEKPYENNDCWRIKCLKRPSFIGKLFGIKKEEVTFFGQKLNWRREDNNEDAMPDVSYWLSSVVINKDLEEIKKDLLKEKEYYNEGDMENYNKLYEKNTENIIKFIQNNKIF